MKHKYSILQLTHYEDSIIRNKMYLSWNCIKDLTGFKGFLLADYDKVYEGSIEGDNNIAMLEELFEIFNIRHPEDFHGHSLSTSDVVILDNTIWYCDSIGWKEIGKVN